MLNVWQILKWSFEHMFFGKHPEKDHLGKLWKKESSRASLAGTPLTPDRKKGVLWAITGDGEYFQNEFKLAGSSHNQCCFNCDANKSDIPLNDFRATAAWRATVKERKGTTPTTHLVGQIPGVSGNTFTYDVMHILELGVTSHCVANCLFDFIVKDKDSHLGDTQEVRCKTIFGKILEQYQEQGIEASNRIGKLSLSNFCNPKAKYDSFPDLSGFKARHIRYLLPCVLEICKDRQIKKDEYTLHRVKVLLNLEKVYCIMEQHHLHLPLGAAEAMLKATDLCLQHYVVCSKMMMNKGLLQWNTVHKHHLFAHIPAQAEFLNPRFVSTYSGETMVGFMASLGHACLAGAPAWLVSEKVAWRFRLGIWLRLSGHDLKDDLPEE